MISLVPNSTVPMLSLQIAGGGVLDLAKNPPAAFYMLVFYRGLHCPICKTYLRDLDKKTAKFRAKGVEPFAVTSDDQGRAEQARKEWGIQMVPFAYGLEIDAARNWGLYISRAIREGEPQLSIEPAIFLVRPNRTLYAASIQTMPFARPQFSEILGAVDYITKNNYPARGEA